MAPLFRAHYSVLQTVMFTPFFFGLAHLHHFHELVRYQGFPAAQALMTVRESTAIEVPRNRHLGANCAKNQRMFKPR